MIEEWKLIIYASFFTRCTPIFGMNVRFGGWLAAAAAADEVVDEEEAGVVESFGVDSVWSDDFVDDVEDDGSVGSVFVPPLESIFGSDGSDFGSTDLFVSMIRFFGDFLRLDLEFIKEIKNK